MEKDKRLASIEKQLKSIPKKPGVYVIYNKKNEIIYIGKAKNLINRLRSHFTISNDFSKSRVIREKGVRIEVHVVSSEKEALLLEFNMIQEHQPILNERWKDGKTYPYLEVTAGEKFPRFIMTRERTNKSSIYLGPFSDVGATKRSLKYALKMFPVADCKKEITLGDSNSWAQTCIRRRTKQCFRPCDIVVDETEYRDNVDQVIQFIEGKTPRIAKDINSKMSQFAENLEFEKAAKLRDILKSINRTIEKQSVMMDGVEDTVIIADTRTKKESCIAIQTIINGKVVRRDASAIEREELENNPWSEYVMSFLGSILGFLDPKFKKPKVKNIILKTVQFNALKSQLTEFGYEISKPEEDFEEKLVQMTVNHAKGYLQRRSLLRKQKGLPNSRVADLQELLNMEYPPFIIDTFDISTLMGTNNVGSCVRYRNGKPLKKGYRRFKVKTVVGQDDFASMEEVVFRRYRDVKDGHDPKGLPIPDLIVIDGGPEQLKRAKNALNKLRLNIITIGLAKREEEIYFHEDKDPISENKNRPGLLLIRSTRDEAHRFAITYQKLLRLKSGLKSILDDVQGIGPVRKKKLLSTYKTVSNIAKESSETLSENIGISKELASAVINKCRKFMTQQSDNVIF